MLPDEEYEKYPCLEACPGMQQNCWGSVPASGPKVTSVLGEKEGFILVWSLVAIDIFFRHGFKKKSCLQCWGRIWWSEPLLDQVGQSSLFGRTWIVTQIARGEGGNHLMVLKILWCVFQTSSLKHALLSSIQPTKRAGLYCSSHTHSFMPCLLVTQFSLQKFSWYSFKPVFTSVTAYRVPCSVSSKDLSFPYFKEWEYSKTEMPAQFALWS